MPQDPNLSMQYPVPAPTIKPARQQEQPVGYSVEVETAVSEDHSTDLNQHDLQGMEQLAKNSWEADLGALQEVRIANSQIYHDHACRMGWCQ